VKETRPYALGEAITLTLTPREAVLLRCKENAFGLREILICAQQGNLFNYAFWGGGRFSGGGRSLAEGHHFSTRGEPSLGFLEDWVIKGNQVVLQFRVVTDGGEIKRLSAEKKAR
jgi:hypothetical protein